jgi:superfamily I DNA/RNA helicase
MRVKTLEQKREEARTGRVVGPTIGTVDKPRIALLAFNKHIATEMQQRLKSQGIGLTGSDEQEAIWKEGLEGYRHMMVNAVAGSGKTSVAIEYCKRSGGDAEAMTYHSLGFKALSKEFGRVELDKWKVWSILDGMNCPVADHLEKVYKARVVKVIELAKQYGKQDRDSLEWMCDRHDVDLNGMAEYVLDAIPAALKRCSEVVKYVDFNDMIWLPWKLELAMPVYDVVISDEAQDLNTIQQQLALKAGDRHIVIGDNNQAIYGFRGADSESMQRMRGLLALSDRGIVDMPLTLTRRCPKLHVAMAQRLVPQIKALDSAPDGKVSTMSPDDAVMAMRPGDMVLCRVNAELLMVAYKLLKRGIKAVVRGKDIGAGIVKLIEKAENAMNGKVLSLPELIATAGSITDAEVAKLLMIPKNRGEMRAAAAQDKYSCLVSISGDAKDSKQVKDRIEQLFADFETDGQPRHAVVLSSVHRGKGLEAGRVFILRPDLMPHPMAKQAHEVEQECNLAYVSITRARFSSDGEGEIIWVGKPCSLFGVVNEEN